MSDVVGLLLRLFAGKGYSWPSMVRLMGVSKSVEETEIGGLV